MDDQDQRTKLFTAGLDYRGDNFRVATDIGYQKQRINHLRNSVRLGSTTTKAPTAPDASHNYGQSWSYSESEDTFGMVRGEWDLSDNWTAYLAGGARHTREQGTYGTPVLVGNSGAATMTPSDIVHGEDNTSFSTGLNGRLQTGRSATRSPWGPIPCGPRRKTPTPSIRRSAPTSTTACKRPSRHCHQHGWRNG